MSRGIARKLAFGLVVFASLASGAQKARSAEGTAEIKPQLPLMAWDYADDEPTLKKMAECGINLVAFVPPKALDACERLGLKAIVYDPDVTPHRWDLPFDAEQAAKALPPLIKQVNGHPAVFGYHLKDEPDGGQFARLAKSVELVREQAPGKWPYINLPPGMGKGYDDYLD